jgi:hypothetical protein
VRFAKIGDGPKVGLIAGREHPEQLNMNRCPDVAAFQEFGWRWCRQHDAIESVNHLALRGNLDVWGAARLSDRHALCLEALEMKRNRTSVRPTAIRSPLPGPV